MAVSISGITLSGVFSNMDTDKLVQASILGAQGPLNRLTTQKTQVLARQKALTDIEGRLNDLADITSQLRDTSSLQTVSGASSDTDVLSLSTTGTAAEGSFAVTVNRLATAHRLVETTGKAAEDSLVGAGQFVYTYGGETRTRATTATTTLAGLRDLINNDSANPGVTATILNVDGNYHLVLSGRDSGSGHSITIDDVQTTLEGFDTADFTQTQAAQSSQIRVDGFPAGSWIERDSNRVSDAIPGVTLSLTKVGSANVTLTRDTSSVSQKLSNLVNIYNGLANKISSYTGYDADTGVAGVLQGDIAVRTINETVRNLLVGLVPGFQNEVDPYSKAADLGLSIDRYGVISLDTETLDKALTDDYAGVLSLLSASGTGSSDNSHVQFTSSSDSTQAGEFVVEVSFGATGDMTSARIRAKDSNDWEAMNIEDGTLIGKEGTAAEGLVLTGVGAGAEGTTVTASVIAQRGLAGQLNDAVTGMLKADVGLIDVSAKRFDAQLTDIGNKIEKQNDRLAKMETALREKYARMESMLAELGAMKSQFEALFSSLESTSNSTSSN